MGMVVRTNTMANNAFRQLGMNNSAVSKSLEKLASGYKINRAGDDAAGLAVSESMKAQITGLEAASSNAQDGISLVQTAEGALTEVHDMLNRMTELATKASNGTYTATQLGNYQDEVKALKDEINRIAETTKFNDRALLDGSLSAGAADDTNAIALASSTRAAAETTFVAGENMSASFGISSIDFGDLEVSAGTKVNASYDENTSVITITVGDKTFTSATLTSNATDLQGKTVELTSGGETITISFADSGVKVGTDQSSGISSTEIGEFQASAASDVPDATFESTTALSETFGIDGLKFSGITTAGDVKASFETTGHVLTITAGGNTFKFDLSSLSSGDLAGKTMTCEAGSTAATIAAAAGGKASLTITFGSSPKVGSDKSAIGETTVGSMKAADDDKATGGLVLQVGTTATSSNQLTVTIADMSCTGLGIDGIDVSTNAAGAIDLINQAINTVSEQRSQLGALQNRLEHTINNLDTTRENLDAANSRIRDTDMAEEMMQYTQMNVLVQSAQAMLAQANQQPQSVLQLLG